jgi:pimeloyl-ACP methyl ester carboxylesterase
MIAGLSFTFWLYFGFRAVGEAGAAVRSDEHVTVTRTDQGLNFQPRANAHAAGLIFLPGGMVEPVAYAPLLRTIARAGYPTYLVNLPMRCACTDSQVSQLFTHVQQVLAGEGARRWILAGHSRGGMLATRFVHENRANLAGLALIGTTHPRDYSLADINMPVTKIYGSRDGVASYRQMRENQHLLPPDTTWIRIDGGNHVQFAYYRHQLGDDDATISREKQQELLGAALLQALSSASRLP